MAPSLPHWLAVALAALLCTLGCDDSVEEHPYGGPDDDDASGQPDDDDTGGQPDDDSADDDSADDDDTGDDDDSADPYEEPDVFVSPQAFAPGDTITVHYRGEYATEEALGIRYGFDGYTEIEGVEGFESGFVDGGNRYYLEASMSVVGDGFDFELEVPIAAQAMHFTFYVTDEDENQTFDDRDELGYHQQVTFPYIGPLLTFTDEAQPGTSVMVTFETSMPCRGTVHHGATEALGSTALGDEVGYVHHVLLDGLPSDSDVYYRVADNVGHTSEVFRFHTPPATTADPWRFAVMSDAQDHGDGLQSWGAVAASVLAGYDDLAAVVFAGDLTGADEAGDWWTFFHGGRELFAGVPLLPALGNNDDRSASGEESTFDRYFPRPAADPEGFVYRVDLIDAAFFALDSEEEDGFADGEDQHAWIATQLDDIAAAGEPSWVFVHWHVPTYDAGTRTSLTNMEELRPVTEAFDGAVDWVFTGHEHLAQRMLPLRYDGVLAPSGDYGRGADDGVGYLVLPPAGTSPRSTVESMEDDEAFRRDWLAFPELADDETSADSELGFAIVTVHGEELTVQLYGIGTTGSLISPHVRDSVTYTRD